MLTRAGSDGYEPGTVVESTRYCLRVVISRLVMNDKGVPVEDTASYRDFSVLGLADSKRSFEVKTNDDVWDKLHKSLYGRIWGWMITALMFGKSFKIRMFSHPLSEMHDTSNEEGAVFVHEIVVNKLRSESYLDFVVSVSNLIVSEIFNCVKSL